MTDEIIEIMEPKASISDERLKQLDIDAELKEGCEDVFMAANLLSQKENLLSIDVEKELNDFHSRMDKRRRLPNKLIAALVAAACIVGIMFMVLNKNPEDEPMELGGKPMAITIKNGNGELIDVKMTTSANSCDKKLTMDKSGKHDIYMITVPFGQALELVLPDSSQVFLHPGSKITYPSEFEKNCRDVKLTGEAYFIVTKDEKRPFTVHTEKSRTRVYGTEFDVTAFRGQTERITLVEGSVGVNDSRLEPGQQAVVYEDASMKLQDVDTEAYTAWRDGFFYFDGEELKDIFTHIARYYNVSIECHDPNLLKYHMRFIIPRNKDVEYAIDMINKMSKVHAELRDRSIVVTEID